jgi:uroporphyrinogen-III decarboxylase
MTSRERLMAVLRGEKIDRIPWAPFLTYWWDQNLIAEAEQLGELGFKRAVGADLLMRGHCDRPVHNQYEDLYMFHQEYEKTKITETTDKKQKQIVYETPIGTLRAGYSYSPGGDTWFLTEHPVKTADDFKTLAYVAADIILTASYKKYEEELKKNPDTLYLPLISPFTKTAFQSMIEFWVGTEELSYFEADYPVVVADTLAVMQRTSMEAARISAVSPARAFISWEDTSTTNISPSWYERYILPEINQWCDILHASDKLYVQHACGHLRHLVPYIAASKIDAIESVSEPPTGNILIKELSEQLPERIAIIGGIEPTFFINSTAEELDARVDMLCDHFMGKRFILANADSCPPMVDIDKFSIVSRRVHENCNTIPPAFASFDKNVCIKPRGKSTYHGSPPESKNN